MPSNTLFTSQEMAFLRDWLAIPTNYHWYVVNKSKASNYAAKALACQNFTSKPRSSATVRKKLHTLESAFPVAPNPPLTPTEIITPASSQERDSSVNPCHISPIPGLMERLLPDLASRKRATKSSVDNFFSASTASTPLEKSSSEVNSSLSTTSASRMATISSVDNVSFSILTASRKSSSDVNSSLSTTSAPAQTTLDAASSPSHTAKNPSADNASHLKSSLDVTLSLTMASGPPPRPSPTVTSSPSRTANTPPEQSLLEGISSTASCLSVQPSPPAQLSLNTISSSMSSAPPEELLLNAASSTSSTATTPAATLAAELPRPTIFKRRFDDVYDEVHSYWRRRQEMKLEIEKDLIKAEMESMKYHREELQIILAHREKIHAMEMESRPRMSN